MRGGATAAGSWEGTDVHRDLEEQASTGGLPLRQWNSSDWSYSEWTGTQGPRRTRPSRVISSNTDEDEERVWGGVPRVARCAESAGPGATW